MPPIKLFILAMLLVIVASLGSALVHLLRGDEASRVKLAKALTVRISLSIALLLFIIVAGQLGWLKPGGFMPPPSTSVSGH